MVSYNCAPDMSLPSLAVTIPPPRTGPCVAALDTWSLAAALRDRQAPFPGPGPRRNRTTRLPPTAADRSCDDLPEQADLDRLSCRPGCGGNGAGLRPTCHTDSNANAPRNRGILAADTLLAAVRWSAPFS